MVASLGRLSRLAFVVACTMLVGTVSATSNDDTVRVWQIGSPHTGETPGTKVPLNLEREAANRGWHLSIEAFPAKGFTTIFREAVIRNDAPDVVVFDNFGVMDGITTRLGTFEGVGEDPTLRQDFIRVTGAFDELLGPRRGWTYLFRLSPNHHLAKTLAQKSPPCASGSSAPTAQDDLMQIVPAIATAYLEGDTATLQTLSDPDRLPPGQSSRGAVDVC